MYPSMYILDYNLSQHIEHPLGPTPSTATELAHDVSLDVLQRPVRHVPIPHHHRITNR